MICLNEVVILAVHFNVVKKKSTHSLAVLFFYCSSEKLHSLIFPLAYQNNKSKKKKIGGGGEEAKDQIFISKPILFGHL